MVLNSLHPHFQVSNAVLRHQEASFLKLALAQIDLNALPCLSTVELQHDLSSILPHKSLVTLGVALPSLNLTFLIYKMGIVIPN